MPILETPPNPNAPPPSAPTPLAPIKLSTRRRGDLEEHELIHLLDSIDDEISRARFRESIYVSVILCIALAWLAAYGPRVLFHQGRIVSATDTQRNDKQLSYLDLPPQLVKRPSKTTKTVSDQDRVAQTKHPVPVQKTPEQLQAMKPAGPPARNLTPAPQPQAQPQPQTPPQNQPQPKPPASQPQQQARQAPPSNVPEAPKPSPSGRPSFTTGQTAGDNIRAAANAAAHGGGGGDYGANAPNIHNGAASGTEILSDTLGVDFGAYLRRIHPIVMNSWVPLIPEETRPPLNKEGSTMIRVTIDRNGAVSDMRLDGSTHDQAIDRAAWGGITGIGQFPPLPKEFTGPNLVLRMHFVISHSAVRGE